jgi:hypothetical protein
MAEIRDPALSIAKIRPCRNNTFFTTGTEGEERIRRRRPFLTARNIHALPRLHGFPNAWNWITFTFA